jgi:hypothetical protein
MARDRCARDVVLVAEGKALERFRTTTNLNRRVDYSLDHRCSLTAI